MHFFVSFEAYINVQHVVLLYLKIDLCPINSDLESDVPEVRKVNPENKNKINEDTETNNKSKEGKQIKVVKKDIRSGGEYYRGWDKYVTSWEKVISFSFLVICLSRCSFP